MPFEYKIDIIKALKDKGYTSYVLRKENLLNEFALTQIRNNRMVSLNTIDKICHLLDCTPNDIIKYVK